MSGAVAALVAKGWVEKRPHPGDAGAALVHVTAEGTAVLSDVRRAHAEAVAARLAGTTDHDTAALATAVAVLRDLVATDDAHGPLGAPTPRKEPRTPPTHEPATDRPASMLDQPRAVWAVAFACVIAFMGIGLVDPILKPIADELGASPSEVSLLFTSYMAVMGVAMLVTGFVSSRIGAKRTLLPAWRSSWSSRAGRLRTRSTHRRLPRRVGSRQRPVHRHRSLHDRLRRPAARWPGHHPVRGRARARHRDRADPRRPARRDLVAWHRSSASPC